MKNYESAKPKEKIYEDLPIPLRIVRDNLDDDVQEVIIDDKRIQADVYKFVKTIAPEHVFKVKHYAGPQALFEKYNVEKQIKEALDQKVNLKSGGSIIVETTQAMTVIDVNTGRYIGRADLEETILQTNLEAAEEVVRQLRLRNIGGLIIIDFIDMASPGNRMKLLRAFEKTLKERDKFQSVVLKVSEFGLVQMTRKRSGKTLQQELMETCQTCHGLGVVTSLQTQWYEMLPKIQEQLRKKKTITMITLSLNPEMFDYVTTVEYDSILYLEKEFKCTITIISNESFTADHYELNP